MFISSTLIGAAALTVGALAQPNDPTRASRDAFTACLQAYVTSSVQARRSSADFAREMPQQCQAEERAYREAVIRAEMAARISRADAEEYATMEITDARRNSRETYPDD